MLKYTFMSPLVEGLRTAEAIGTPYFTVDLDSGEPFDPDQFDQMFASLALGKMTRTAKFVVQDGRMYVFSESRKHTDFQKSISGGQLQCAGRIVVIQLVSTTGRIITDSSDTLASLLPESKSAHYKRTILGEKLSQYFDIK